MHNLIDKEKELIEEQLLADAYIDFQKHLQKNRILPPELSSLSRWKTFLSVCGGIHLGVLIACMVLFLNFVILNLVFHL